MNLKQLNNEEIVKVYNDHMVIDFPAGELKPLDVIQKLIKKKIYICYGLYDDEKLLAYAFLVTSKAYLLIDYCAVCREFRNSGFGSQLLNILKEKCKDYQGIIVEVEKVEFAPDDNERLIRERRINFYKKNGFIMTDISIILFGVNFSIMCLCNVEADDSIICEGLKGVYKEIVPEKLYAENVKIKL